MIHFSKLAHGPAWERWIILEDQHGDMALAGQAILTYTDISTYADVECDILFFRDLSDTEADDLLETTLSTILSGRGNVNVYTSHEVVSKGFSLLEDEDVENSN